MYRSSEFNQHKEQILETAKKLFYTQGFDRTTVQDILDERGIAKGTFYYYFNSKMELLDILVQHLTDRIIHTISPIVSSDKSAVEKMNGLLEKSKLVKLSRKDLMFTLINVLYREENIRFRHKVTKKSAKKMLPLFTRVIIQGNKEGVFNAPFPEETAEFIFAIMASSGERFAGLLKQAGNGDSVTEEIKHLMKMTRIALTRILQAPEGCFKVYNYRSIKEFIDEFSPQKKKETSHN